MNFFKKYFQHPFEKIIEIIDNHEINMSGFIGKCIILMHFFQILSYLLKLYYYEENSPNFNAFSLIFYYSNFSNFLPFLEKSSISMILYIIANFIVYYPMIFLIMTMTWYQNKENRGISMIFKKIYTLIVGTHMWVLILPINDIFLTVFNDNDEIVINGKSMILYIFSLMGIAFNFLLGVFALWINRNLMFFNEKSLKINSELLSVFSFIFCFLLTFLSFIQNIDLFYYFLLHFIFLFNLFYKPLYKTFPIRSNDLCRFYYGSLISYEIIVVLMTIWRYSSIILSENVFYIAILLFFISFKYGMRIFENLYEKTVFIDITNAENFIYYIEEIVHLSRNLIRNDKNFILCGIFKHHFKHCHESSCLDLYKHFLMKNEIMTTKNEKNVLRKNDNLWKNGENYLSNKLILSKYKAFFTKNSKKAYNSAYFIVKFMSFLLNTNLNPVKTLLEIQKILCFYKKSNQSFLEEVTLCVLRKKIIKRIKIMQNVENSLNSELSTEHFFKIMKLQSSYEKELMELLQAKRVFWESYQNGINSMSALISLTSNLNRKIDDFHHKITPSRDKTADAAIHLIQLKYLSIFHSILVNSVNLAFKFEDEYENIVNRQINHGDDKILKKLSFLDPNILICLVSFLKYDGKFREDSKTEKIAHFFGYSAIEFRSIKTIKSVMPKYIASYHDHFIANYFKRNKRPENQENTLKVDSFALNKNEFIFPIRVFFGYNFDYKDDFVMIAAIMRPIDNTGESYHWLCEEGGMTIGVSENIYNLFKSTYDFINKSHMNQLILPCMIPDIKYYMGIIKENKEKFKIQQFINKSGYLHLPENLKEILEAMNTVNKEMENETYKDSSFHSKSIKTVYSINSRKSQKVGLKKVNLFKNTIINFDYVNDSDSLKAQLFENYMKNTISKKFAIIFDCFAQMHYHGAYQSDYILVINVNIKTIKLNTDSNDYVRNLKKNEKSTIFIKKDLEDISKSDVLSSDIRGLSGLFPKENPLQFKQIFDKSLVFEVEDPIRKNSENSEKREKDANNEKIENYEIFVKTEKDEKSEKSDESVKNEINEQPTLKFKKTSNISSNIDFNANSFGIESNNKNNEFKEKTSKISSSVNESKTIYLIYASINMIQTKFPSNIKRIMISFFIETLLIMGYFAVLYTLYQQYVNQNYEPIQKSLINYCSLATSFSYSTAIFSEIEYKTYNLTNRTYDNLKRSLWTRIMQYNYDMMKTINYEERNIEGNLPYQKIYKNVQNKFIDYETLKMETLYYADTFEFYSDLIYQTINDFNRILPQNFQIILQRNYPYVLPATSAIYLAVKNDFTVSNQGTTQNILYVLIAFMLFMGVLKVFEVINMLNLHQMITQIMTIFRRVNLQDSIAETKFYHEMIQIMHNEQFLMVRFTDKCFNKKVNNISEGQALASSCQNSSSSRKTVKTKKIIHLKKQKFSFYNMKQLPKTKVIILMLLIFSLSFIYYFFNYYFWITNNQKINNLIEINLLLIDVYIYSTSILGFNTMAIRERVAHNPEYESLSDIYQNPQTRMSYFYTNMMKRLYLIGNTTASSLTQYTLEAQSSMKNKEFDQLVLSNICELLQERGILTEDDELSFCEGSFNGAIKKGILPLVMEYLQTIKNQEIYTEIYKDASKINQQILNAKEFVNSKAYEDFMFSYYYYIRAQLIYYNAINDYYKGLMDEEMNKLYLFLILTSLVWGGFFLCLGLILRRKLAEYYKYVALSLSLIPYDRLLHDEQTKFLINNFIKKIT